MTRDNISSSKHAGGNVFTWKALFWCR